MQVNCARFTHVVQLSGTKPEHSYKARPHDCLQGSREVHRAESERPSCSGLSFDLTVKSAARGFSLLSGCLLDVFDLWF